MRLQRLQYGPVVHGLQVEPSAFAHAVASGEDASGQRLRSELLSFVRQYPGSKGRRARVDPDPLHSDPIGHDMQTLARLAPTAPAEQEEHGQGDAYEGCERRCRCVTAWHASRLT